VVKRHAELVQEEAMGELEFNLLDGVSHPKKEYGHMKTTIPEKNQL